MGLVAPSVPCHNKQRGYILYGLSTQRKELRELKRWRISLNYYGQLGHGANDVCKVAMMVTAGTYQWLANSPLSDFPSHILSCLGFVFSIKETETSRKHFAFSYLWSYSQVQSKVACH